MDLNTSVEQFVSEKIDYYKQWIFEEPIIVSPSHNEKVVKLQKIMFKLITGFVENYQSFKHLMPVTEQIEAILDICAKTPYKPGTYRTDFVYDAQKQIKIIEITCRFGMNGMFLSALMNKVAQDYKISTLPELNTKEQFAGIYEHLLAYLQDKKSVYVLVGDDQRNESKLFKEIFQRTGRQVHRVHYKEIGQSIHNMEDAFIISELSFDEICAIPLSIIEQLSEFGVFNDFRTIFLIHDKRFFSVMGKKALQEAFLTQEEIDFFKQFYIPTYTSGEHPEIWERARLNKNQWIIKHRALGKSQQVFAGIVTEKDTWENLFNAEYYKDLVLQEWIPQNTFFGKINQKEYKDYVTGTLLFFDDAYYGFGDFRTSSFPVTNKVDHRKATSLILADGTLVSKNHFLNYIP